MKRKLLLLTFCSTLFFFPWRFHWQGSQADNSEAKMVLTQRSKVIVTVNNVITNTCNGTAGIHSPEEQELFAGYNALRGQSVTLGPYDAGTELIFYLSPSSWCGGHTYLSTNSLHAHVTPLEAPNSWRIDWEDMPDDYPPDNDFNDLILVVRAIGTVPDFKQDRPDDQEGWENDPYDNIDNTIGRVGCATTAAADVLHYYGAAAVNPQTLDDCLSRDDVRGYVRWEDDLDCVEGRMDKCDAGAIDWTRVEFCSDPNNPEQKPYLMTFVRKLEVGDVYSEEELKKLADEDLDRGWPVIFEVEHPNSSSGSHFVVATGRQGETYQINDPLCGDWPECPESGDTLEDYGDKLLSIILYKPSDGIFRPTLILEAFSPVEFYITDPQGRRTGYLPDGTHLADIPDANYYFQAPLVDEQTGQVVGDGFKRFYLIDASPGDYTVTVTGTDNGAFSLLAEYAVAPLTIYSSQETKNVSIGTRFTYSLRVRTHGSLELNLEESIEPYPIETQPSFMSPVPQSTISNGTQPGVLTSTPDIVDTSVGIPITGAETGTGNGFGIVVLLFVLVGGGVAVFSFTSRSRREKRKTTSVKTSRANLVGLSGDYMGEDIRLATSGILIGRGAFCNLRLAGQMVSRQHARLRYSGGRWFIQDMGSQGGTFVNNVRIDAIELHNGDRIRIGTTEFRFSKE